MMISHRGRSSNLKSCDNLLFLVLRRHFHAQSQWDAEEDEKSLTLIYGSSCSSFFLFIYDASVVVVPSFAITQVTTTMADEQRKDEKSLSFLVIIFLFTFIIFMIISVMHHSSVCGVTQKEIASQVLWKKVTQETTPMSTRWDIML